MSEYKVNKDKCIGCGVCVATCTGAYELEGDGKSHVIDQEKADKCGGETICPYGAIEKIG